MLKRIFFLLALTFVTSALLFAQITTSSISGTVTSSTGEPLVGATIIATHQPSGTRYSTISRAGGEYTIANMRVGGPYLIQISFIGFDMEKADEVYLKLAENFIVNSSLTKTVGTLENVIVSTGRRNPILNSGRTGAVTNIGLRQIQQLPSITRSINDFTRAAPQAGGRDGSIAGGNYRQNNFTIDGAEFNNSFGIGTNLPANGAPISIDAIEELSINITPFDVRQSGFIGSAINAVTRAGTNSFSGSVYNYFRNERQRGDKVEKTTFIRPLEQYKLEGVRLGGPIIKNKLFFFFNYEKETQPKTVQTRFAATSAAPYGSSPQIARPTADSLNYIRQYLLDKYDYETGPFDNYSTDILRKKIMGRIDWNISSKHRFNARYSQVEGGEPNPISNSVGGTGLSNITGLSRTDNNSLWFKNSNYFQGANYYSFAAELNSNLGKFSNTLRGTYTYQNDSRSSDSKLFPLVDIMSATGVSAPAPYTSFGYEPFSFLNLRKVKTYSFVDNLSWKTKNHSLTVGVQVDISKTINGFNPFGASYYRFASWDDFATGKKPTDFAITYSLSPGFAPAISAFKFTQSSVYGQDEITVTKNFKLTLGLRIDQPSYPSVPQVLTNPLLLSLNFEGGEKINTGNLPSKRLMWSPRLGFNWDLYGDRSLQIRGGTGIFTGKVPFVWIVSQSGTNGMILVTQPFNGVANTPGPFDPNTVAYRPSSVPPRGTIVPATITAMVNNFKNPQSWKTSIAVDTKLPWGLIGSIEGIFNKDLNSVFFRNPNYKSPVPLNIAGYPDNRPFYGVPIGTDTRPRFINTLNSALVPNVGPQFSQFNPIIIDNGSKGYYASLTLRLDKLFNKGFFASIAYTKSVASNLHDGGGDQPMGAYQNTPQVIGLNTPQLSYAGYVVPDRVIATLSYRKEYIRHLGTTVSLLYQGSIDGRFSYVYGADFNSDAVTGNDLIYIPTNARDTNQIKFVSQTLNGVVYSPAAQGQLFEAYINQDKYLKAHRGQYAERNGAQIPWRNQVDVKLLQDLFINIGKRRQTFQFSLDILNFGNLLNASWGKVKTINASSILVPTNQASLTPGGTTVPTFRLAADRGNIITRTFRDNVSTISTYSMQFGVRYIFNQ